MNSSPLDVVTSECEVTNITQHGFYLLVDGCEYFVPFNDYPVFRAASIPQLYNLQRTGPSQLYWSELDADIELEALEHPEHYQLVFRP